MLFLFRILLAGGLGIDPRESDPETDVLPLDDPPTGIQRNTRPRSPSSLAGLSPLDPLSKSQPRSFGAENFHHLEESRTRSTTGQRNSDGLSELPHFQPLFFHKGFETRFQCRF